MKWLPPVPYNKKQPASSGLFSYAENFLEKCGGIIVAANRFRMGNGHMEHMADSFVIFAAVAVQPAADALFCQKIIHGLCVPAHKIMMCRGNMSRWIIGSDRFQNLQAGIGQIKIPSQIIPGDTGEFAANKGVIVKLLK